MDDPLLLADPRLAVAFLATLRQDGNILIDDLEDPGSAQAWVRRAGFDAPDATAIVELRSFRDELRTLFTAVVTGDAPNRSILDRINRAAGEAPPSLKVELTRSGTIEVKRTTRERRSAVIVRAELARAALALLLDPVRGQLRLCDAPNCIRFFRKEHPRQEWCSPGCGNRARVARHYARHRRR